MNEDLREVSDGRLYTSKDMVKVGCRDCQGCHSCCCDMGESIRLDPYDIHRLTRGLSLSFEQLMEERIALHMEDGLIIPHLNMTGQDKPACSFLNAEGRCSIHAIRPGICRLFPLGRHYEEGRLHYFLLRDACPAKNKTKCKVDKWIDTDDLRQYEAFLVQWHDFTKGMKIQIQKCLAQGDGHEKKLVMSVLQYFYVTPYDPENFYWDFQGRLKQFSDNFCA